MRTLALAFLALSALPLFAAAQRLRGRVFLSDSVTAAAGVVVVASDDKGQMAARALSNERGDFELRLPRAGRYEVRVLRIGFRPTLMPAIDVGADEVRALRVVVHGEPIALTAVTVRGESVCRIRQDSGQLVARLWDEAAKAIASTQLSAPGEALEVSWITYDRATDVSGNTILAERSAAHRGATDRPFVSLASDSLARVGYVTESAGETAYHGPDAEVLLSESFAALHCFRTEPPPAGHPDWIGIAFRPARERRGIADIEGTLWLDRESAELRLLEYRYTGVRVEYLAATIGGVVEFLRLPTGNWLVNQWAIRMPRARVVVTEKLDRTGIPLQRRGVEVEGLKITGGEVERVERGGAVLYTTGESRRDSSNAPQAGGAEPDVACTGGSASTASAEPTSLYGVVYDARHQPVVGAQVDVRWQSDVRASAMRTWRFETFVRTATTGELGVWRMCDVPRRKLVWVRATVGDVMSQPVTVKFPWDRSWARVDLQLPPH